MQRLLLRLLHPLRRRRLLVIIIAFDAWAVASRRARRAALPLVVAADIWTSERCSCVCNRCGGLPAPACRMTCPPAPPARSQPAAAAAGACGGELRSRRGLGGCGCSTCRHRSRGAGWVASAPGRTLASGAASWGDIGRSSRTTCRRSSNSSGSSLCGRCPPHACQLRLQHLIQAAQRLHQLGLHRAPARCAVKVNARGAAAAATAALGAACCCCSCTYGSHLAPVPPLAAGDARAEMACGYEAARSRGSGRSRPLPRLPGVLRQRSLWCAGGKAGQSVLARLRNHSSRASVDRRGLWRGLHREACGGRLQRLRG